MEQKDVPPSTRCHRRRTTNHRNGEWSGQPGTPSVGLGSVRGPATPITRYSDGVSI